MAQAAGLEIPQVIALTRNPGFFRKLGFRIVPRETLPRKIWKDCITCTKFVGCDEVAMVREVDGGLGEWRLEIQAAEDGKNGSLERGKNGRLQNRVLESSGSG
jgi:hypothetical protein